jgi:hypothetical protein
MKFYSFGLFLNFNFFCITNVFYQYLYNKIWYNNKWNPYYQDAKKLVNSNVASNNWKKNVIYQ